MEQIKIEVPKGYQIDLEKSDLSAGIVKFKKIKRKKLPKSWEEVKEIKGYYINDISRISYINKRYPTERDKNIFKTDKQAEAAIALAQLSIVRDIYRQGWEPDWNDRNQFKYGIRLRYEDFVPFSCFEHPEFLVFQSERIRDSFFNNFKDLIEKAKPLMS